MLLVSASVRPSAIHGMGCFTNERIVKGQLVWRYDPRLDRRLPAAEVEALPAAAQEFVRMYGYLETIDGQPVYTLCGDHARHMNHTTTPNLLNVNSMADSALRDIEPGEELTCNYYAFDLDSEVKLSPPATPHP